MTVPTKAARCHHACAVADGALNRYQEIKARIPNLTVVGIAGPGDAWRILTKTQKTLQMIRMADKDVTFVFHQWTDAAQYVEQITSLGVSHVTVTVNAVDVAIGSRIYKHVRYMGQIYTGEAAAAMLLANQMAGIKMLAGRGVMGEGEYCHAQRHQRPSYSGSGGKGEAARRVHYQHHAC
jgi:MoaA/NifB/PqqE/SkfB family radical SAM enzyme